MVSDVNLQPYSPGVMAGYLNDPEASARTVTADGWLDTGDLGWVAPERLAGVGAEEVQARTRLESAPRFQILILKKD